MSHRRASTRNRFTASLLLLAVTLVAPAALANGRFPRGQRLVESATDANLLALYGTYGLIVSRDAGHSWNHVCEAATGTYTGEDPLLEILPDGRIVARTVQALIRSGDSWCNWTSILSDPQNGVVDITRALTEPLSIDAILGSYTPGRGFSSEFVESTDGGTTWSNAKALPVIARGLSLDVAPSSTKRIVVSGLDATGAGKLLLSDDGGGTWQANTIATTDSNSAPYLAAISKNDQNRLFVRTDGYHDINGVDTANDALLLSVDAGTTWTAVIQRNAKLFGFALSPDESTLLVGYGDPVVSAMYVAPADLGIYRADMATILSDLPNAPTHFEKIFGASVTCLRWTITGLFACTSQKALGFEVGRAPDATFALTDPNPFTPLLELPEVRPLPCSTGTNGYACFTDPDNGFASVCRTFQTSCDASPPPPGMGGRDSGADAAPSGGTGGSTAGAGGTAKSGADDSSCACSNVGSRGSNRIAPLLAAFVAAFANRRRRKNALPL